MAYSIKSKFFPGDTFIYVPAIIRSIMSYSKIVILNNLLVALINAWWLFLLLPLGNYLIPNFTKLKLKK